MIKAIVFDIGGVLVDLNYNQALQSFRTKAGFENIEEFLDPWRQRGFFSDMEEGKLSEEEFTEECLKHCRPGTRPEVLEECLNDFIVGMNPRKAQIIKALYGKYELGLLSNNNPISMRCCERLMQNNGIPMKQYFRKRFISSDMKMVKPEADIYLAAIAELGCRPEEILFVDDSQKNVDAALSLGINARLCRTDEDFFAIFAPMI